MTKTLIVLGASSDQRFLIRSAKEMGQYVLAFDQNPAAPAFEDADRHAVLSTRDVDALAGWLDEERQRLPTLGGVITMGSDIPVEVASLAARFDLPHIAHASAALATDKLAMKERFRERGIPVPWFAEVHSGAELSALAKQRGLPLVLKPIDRSGSRGVFLLDERSDLNASFARARDVSYAGRVMVEEFINGPQISTETLLWGERAATPGFADRNYELLERFLPQIMENGGWVPSALEPGQRALIEETATAAARALDIEAGVAKGDLVLGPDGPVVIEIAARLSGGDFCESLVPLGTGVNYVREAIRIALGEEPDFEALEPRFERAVANRYLFPAPGRLRSVKGTDAVRAQPWVHKLELNYRPGQEVPPTESHAHRFGVFVVSGDDRTQAQERVDWVYDSLRISTD